MKELVILSGKGGTGKTSLTAAFAALAKNMVLCDTDVDAADLHLVLKPGQTKAHDFVGGNEAAIDPERCTGCGICLDICRFDAVRQNGAEYAIDPIACEGCGVCADMCPAAAIDFDPVVCGQWYVSSTRFGPMVHARLGIAQENSGKLVSQVRQQARQTAEKQHLDLILTDGPPGVGCPVIAAISQATAILIVTEPTMSGRHDMDRVLQLASHFRIPAMICVNKWDLNPDQTRQILEAAEKKGLPVVGKIPFDRGFTDAMVQGQTLFEYNSNPETANIVRQIWEAVHNRLEQESSQKLILQHL